MGVSTQKAVAEILGIPESQLTDVKKTAEGKPRAGGSRRIPWQAIIDWALDAGVSVDWLLTGVDPRDSIPQQEEAVLGHAPQWFSELGPRLAALDETSQLAIKGALEGMLGPLEAKRLNETLTKPPPRKAAAGPARARRR